VAGSVEGQVAGSVEGQVAGSVEGQVAGSCECFNKLSGFFKIQGVC
jgi:hypothetical protein